MFSAGSGPVNDPQNPLWILGDTFIRLVKLLFRRISKNRRTYLCIFGLGHSATCTISARSASASLRPIRRRSSSLSNTRRDKLRCANSVADPLNNIKRAIQSCYGLPVEDCTFECFEGGLAKAELAPLMSENAAVFHIKEDPGCFGKPVVNHRVHLGASGRLSGCKFTTCDTLDVISVII